MLATRAAVRGAFLGCCASVFDVAGDVASSDVFGVASNVASSVAGDVVPEDVPELVLNSRAWCIVTLKDFDLPL
jgi:hypothetical protein